VDGYATSEVLHDYLSHQAGAVDYQRFRRAIQVLHDFLIIDEEVFAEIAHILTSSLVAKKRWTDSKRPQPRRIKLIRLSISTDTFSTISIVQSTAPACAKFLPNGGYSVSREAAHSCGRQQDEPFIDCDLLTARLIP
jgi:hypothetical protein